MKTVILSADGDRMLYLVPDQVAENLEAYCCEFCCEWLPNSPYAAKYRRNGVLYYTEADFIAYLNQYLFPEEPAALVANLGWINWDAPLPAPYADCPQFNF